MWTLIWALSSTLAICKTYSSILLLYNLFYDFPVRLKALKFDVKFYDNLTKDKIEAIIKTGVQATMK